MKRYLLFLGAVAVLALTSCLKASDPNPAEVTGPVKKFTFTVKGNFSQDFKTKAGEYLYADGKTMTDLWVLDYMGDELVQQIHQTTSDADWGQPTMNLKYGEHHIYFVASRGQSPTLNTTSKTVTFTKVLDTFWKDYAVTVVSTSNGNRAVTLDRVVTRLKITFTDAIPEGTATFALTPTTWNYGINYATGEPCETKTSTAVTIDVPSNLIGNTGETLNLYGFSSATEWTTNVTVAAKKSDGTVIGEATLENVPLKRNRSTEYSGPLFMMGGEVGITLNSEWLDSVTDTW
jgi:hypothetical protein